MIGEVSNPMNQIKKIMATLIFVLFITSSVFSMTGASAVIYRVSGYVTIDGLAAPENIQIKIEFSDGTENDVTSETGYYQIDWNAEDGSHISKYGSFFVFYSGNWYAPEDNQTVYIAPGTPTYEINIAIDTDSNPLENHPPLAYNDDYETDEDQTLEITENDGVLDNDEDVDEDPLTAELVSDVSHGSLDLEDNGAFTYTPNADYHGTDTFTYKAYDGLEYSNEATVTITINSVEDTFRAPSQPSPQNDSTGVGINIDISWLSSYPDDESQVNYTIYFGTSTNPPLVYENHSDPSYDPGTLQYETTYYWYVTAWKGQDMLSGPLWHFTTEEEDTGGGGGNPPPTEENQPPVADASLSDTTGIVNEPVNFDGTASTDDSGIVSYEWDFGDDSNGTGATTTHTYTETGEYAVTLVVKDEEGLSNDHTITVTIGEDNYPPTAPTITGPSMGNTSVVYTFSMESTDQDDTHIQYDIDWGDDETTTTDFMEQGTSVDQTHAWTSAGMYIISIRAYDNETYSSSTTHTLYIDAIPVDPFGYLVDEDGDGIYDTMYNDQGESSPIEHTDTGYLINTDGNEGWDYVFDPQTGTVSEFTEDQPDEEETVDNTMLIVGAGLLVLVLIGGIGYFVWKKQQK